jgi:hypothetical protein
LDFQNLKTKEMVETCFGEVPVLIQTCQTFEEDKFF